MEEASMADKQPPGEEAAMVVSQQKLGESAMVVDQKPPAGEAAAARYPVAEVAEVIAFLNGIMERLEAAPSVRDKLLDLVVRFGSSGHGGDARAVASSAAGLLIGHPDVLGSFTAFLAGAKAAPAAEPLAVTRPRRSSARRPRSVPPPAAVEEPEGDAGGDPRVLDALAFLERVGEVAGREAYDRFVEVLDGAGSNRGMAAGEIYGAVRGALGLAHGCLLAKFAASFLPGKDEWAKEEARLARNRRRAEARATAAAARAADDQKPPRADYDVGDGHRLHGLHGVESSFFQVTLEIVKKRRAGDGDHHGHDDGGGYAPRVRTKKARTGDGSHRNAGTNCEPTSKNRAPARVVDGGDRKPRRRGAANGGGGGSSAAAAPAPSEEESALFRHFRELWVSYTRYSALVGTMARAQQLLAAADGGGEGGIPATVEEMFPRRESREFLAGYYGGHWGSMRALLESERAGAALEVVVESLQRKEERAVDEERRRQDAPRAAERLACLVRDRVHREERRRMAAARRR